MAFWRFKKTEIKQAPPVGTAIYVAGVAGATWMGEDKYALEGYMQNAVAYACINKRAQAFGSIEYNLVSYIDGERKEVEKSPLIDLLDRPNPTQSWSTFIEALESYRLIHGNAYVLRILGIGKRPSELWLLRPDRVTIHHDSRGFVSKYEYKAGAGSVFYPVDATTGDSDVLHIKMFHPQDDFVGLSPMSPSARNVDIVNEAMVWNKSLLENGARPSGAFVMKTEAGNAGNLSDEQFTRIREQLRESVAGSANSGKPMILEGGLDWKEMSLSPKDMDFQENLWASARLIATAYGVPPQLINVKGESTYNNYSEAKTSFWTDTMIPSMKIVLGQLSAWLTPAFGKNLFIEIDEDDIPALEDKRNAKYERVEAISFLTINEKRKICGHDPIDGGDNLLVESGKVPIGILSDAEQA
jgi:HK97 family phage portal protein